MICGNVGHLICREKVLYLRLNSVWAVGMMHVYFLDMYKRKERRCSCLSDLKFFIYKNYENI